MEAGYLVRTKPCDSDEGGVASGYSVLNSLALTGVGKKEWEEVDGGSAEGLRGPAGNTGTYDV